ncbi:MAG: hypothetical protein KKF41_08350 [Actinobacteria bacterium]|nr:hypothetical protein [Actinomycetota bacterium]MBU1942851.1 hypothetical protein [Actinomycetota bacterium]MBU2687583.1 hypothetical protein [Actinomycetota bacterium]
MRKAILITLIVVIVLTAGAIAFLVYRSYEHGRQVKEYKAALKADWKKISERSSEVAAALDRVSTPGDLQAVANATSEFSEQLAEVSGRSQRARAPAGYGELSEKETQVLKDLGSYADMLDELALKADENTIKQSRGTLEYRAGKAKSDFSDFVAKSGFLQQEIGEDFFRGGAGLEAAYAGEDLASEQSRQEVYDVMSATLTADVKDHDYATVYSLLSTRLHTGFDYYKMTRERMIDYWPKAWGENKPVDFFVSRRDMEFPDANTAVVKVIAYLDGAPPVIEQVRLVREPSGWLVDSYPFTGFL